MTARIISMFSRSECNPGADHFAAWYTAYPRKAARADAEKAFIQMLRKGHSIEVMLAGAQCYGAMHRKMETEPRYMLLPASFLRGERFLDEELQAFIPPSPEQIAESKDRADRLLKRGKYRTDLG